MSMKTAAAHADRFARPRPRATRPAGPAVAVGHARAATALVLSALLAAAALAQATQAQATQAQPARAQATRAQATRAQPGDPPAPAANRAPTIDDAIARMQRLVPGFVARLGALHPREPEAYVLLGEEVAAEAVSDADVALARQLYAMGYELSGGSPAWAGVRAMAARALAELADSDRDRRWLVAVASRTDPAAATPDWTRSAPSGPPPEVALAAADAVTAVLNGDGSRARALLAQPEVRSVITRYSGLLGGAGPTDSISRLDAQSQIWPCPECRGRRISPRGQGDSLTQELCRTCNGTPGWQPSPTEFVGTVRFRSTILRGAHRSWAAQAASDLAAPLRDPDPDEVGPTFGVTASRPYWSGSGWSATPALSPPSPPPPPGP